jgi:hypothetical protein
VWKASPGPLPSLRAKVPESVALSWKNVWFQSKSMLQVPFRTAEPVLHLPAACSCDSLASTLRRAALASSLDLTGLRLKV